MRRNSAPGMFAAASRLASIGMIGSTSPWTTTVGTDALELRASVLVPGMERRRCLRRFAGRIVGSLRVANDPFPQDLLVNRGAGEPEATLQQRNAGAGSQV